MYTCAVEMGDRIPTRHKPTFVQLLTQRAHDVERPLCDLPLTLDGNRDLEFKWSEHGVYSLGPADEDGAIKFIRHRHGEEVTNDDGLTGRDDVMCLSIN